MIPDTPSSIVNPGSDDEDSDGRSQSQLSYKERRREAHTQVFIEHVISGLESIL